MPGVGYRLGNFLRIPAQVLDGAKDEPDGIASPGGDEDDFIQQISVFFHGLYPGCPGRPSLTPGNDLFLRHNSINDQCV